VSFDGKDMSDNQHLLTQSKVFNEIKRQENTNDRQVAENIGESIEIVRPIVEDLHAKGVIHAQWDSSVSNEKEDRYLVTLLEKKSY
jgi:hypothetical protein